MSVAVDAADAAVDNVSTAEAKQENDESKLGKEETIPAFQKRESKPGFWHSATREDCQNAEDLLVHNFVDLKKFYYEAIDVVLPKFDPTPLRIIEKQKKDALTSFSLSNLFSWQGSNKVDDKSKTNDKNETNNSTTSNDNNSNDNNSSNNSNSLICKKNGKSKFESENDSSSNDVNAANVDLQVSNNENDNDNNKKNEANKDNNESSNVQPLATKSKSMFVKSTNGENGASACSKCGSKAKLGKSEWIHTLTFGPRKNDSSNNENDTNDNDTNNNNNETKEESKNEEATPIVLAHGYGCAGAVFIPSINTIYDELSKFDKESKSDSLVKNHANRKIHLIDWLGIGLSSRAKFLCEDALEAETFFVESLEEWRRVMGIKRMILVGHSLGGYMSCVYAFKYPQYISHLILLSPVGLPEAPADFGDLSKYPWKTRLLFSTFRSLWDKGYTPHDIIRWVGPKGQSMVQSIVDKRLFRLDDTEHGKKLKPLLADYLYHATHEAGSGEYALNKVLMPGAYAYLPLYTRLPQLSKYQRNVNNSIYKNIPLKKEEETKEESTNEKKEENSKNDGKDASASASASKDSKNDKKVVHVDIVADAAAAELQTTMKIDFMYGENDWMDSKSAERLRKDGKIKCNIYQIEEAGHQLLLENSQVFATKLAGIIANGELP